MNIIVVGCGKIGRSIIGSLVSEGHDVAVIDIDHDVITEITDIYDVIGVCGIGTDCEVLEEAGAAKADIVIAVTGSDELNMLSCYIAKTLGAKQTVARIREREYNDNSLDFMKEKLQISMAVNPELFTAYDIYNVLKLPGAAHIETFSTHSFEMVELVLKEGSPLVGTKIMNLRKQHSAIFLVCVVSRNGKVVIPDGQFELEVGDRIALTAAPSEIYKLLKSLKLIKKQVRNIMILGASRTAYYLAELLLNLGNSVTIIDKDPKKCESFSEALPNATIILGDGAQQNLLLEEGLEQMDAFVSLTGMDENNILISYFASTKNVSKVVTKVNRDEFLPIAKHLGIETIVSPIRTISDVLVRYARALQNTVGSNVEKLYKIMEGQAEALMFKVHPDFKHINTPLKEISFKPNILIGGLLRKNKAIVPTGDDVILPDDKVVVISTGHRLCDLADIIE
ncbi:MAG: Trk system potassium transporter TrkA [Ruminococcaceae bacterium]|nr:Trk system potassium transporter TrkA [Oscillospiraceae bacterium]